MRDFTMYSPLTVIYFLLLQLTVLVAGVPSEFWAQMAGFLDVPESIQVAAAPFLGSVCIVVYEYIEHIIKDTPMPKSALYWPLKVFVGWIVGALLWKVLTPFFNGPQPTVAFIGGAAGYRLLGVWLNKKLGNIENKDDNG